MKNFGEFFNDQVENAACIVLSHTQSVSDDKINECVELLKQHNNSAVIVTTPWDKLTGAQLLDAMERTSSLEAEIKKLEEQAHEHEHHHDGESCHHEHHHHDGECCHHEHEHEHEHEHHHHDGESCHHDHDHEHEHEHHHHDGECCHHEHEHHHDYDEHGNCSCGHHHDHHADEVFVSYGVETVKKFNPEALKAVLDSLTDNNKYGTVLRAKGIVESDDGRWIHFDYIPGESDIRFGAAGVTGRLCVIGSELNKDAISCALGVDFK